MVSSHQDNAYVTISKSQSTCNCRAPSAGHRAGKAKPRLETLHQTLLIVVLKVICPFDHHTDFDVFDGVQKIFFVLIHK